jgi:hypothetical protein
MQLQFGRHVLFRIFETAATDRDRQAFTEPLPSVIFRPESQSIGMLAVTCRFTT